MFSKLRVVPEPFITFFAVERFLPCMDPYMSFQVCFPNEFLVAVLANKIVLLVVDFLMSAIGSQMLELVLADLACVRCFAGVSSDVSDEVSFACRLVCTFVAVEESLRVFLLDDIRRFCFSLICVCRGSSSQSFDLSKWLLILKYWL